jgi:membrane-bound ClpP family serine protease
VFNADQLHAQALLGVDAFNDLWVVALGLFGIHLLIIGYLTYRSGYVPRLLGVLLAIAGLGYAIDSVGIVLSQSPWTSVASYTFVGEFLFALWLVIRGRHITF